MTNGVFLIAEDGTLIEMAPAPPESEDRLQALIADYPDLLAGDQIDHGSPRRWLLVSREMAVPDSRAATRWAVDHLFLDQDGVPTLVEVKRHGDTRARRAVVGQMLDYGANAVVHWPVDVIKDRYAAHCAAGGRDADEALRTFLVGERQIDEFWDKVDTNLKEWNLRLIFVADDVPRELQRIVEFLNLQMDRAEVLAVEIKEYAGAGRRTVVPRVIGQSVEAQQKKVVARTGQRWTEEKFFTALASRCGDAELQAASRIYDWARDTASFISWGRGKMDGSFTPVVDMAEAPLRLFALFSDGRIVLHFGYLLRHPPFDDHVARRHLLDRLNTISAIAIPPDRVNAFPTITLENLREPEAAEAFVEAFDGSLKLMRAGDRQATVTARTTP